MECNRCWPVTGVALVIVAAACAGNARTPLVTDTPLSTKPTQLGLRALALARLQDQLQKRGMTLPANLKVFSSVDTTVLANPCAVSDPMPVGKDSTASVPMPNGGTRVQNAVRMPNPCIVAQTRK